ncbi:hypothetical protein IFT67_10310 [Sphingomonas sp. CFBP 13728]|uniref:hypothetical protein n=1 Tax=Sphingomonas sp. CFBP 13728 TaxID=2775294 RepID=UPI00177FCCDB|nr:hypothetical protein [Sphingomonas sp. CFBP 13728]MBD8619312.1 hypothetical protein [Sphingomonas sp. CFBP 13728]
MANQEYAEGQKARQKDGSIIVMKGGHWVATGPTASATAPKGDAVMKRQAAATLSKEQPIVDAAHRGLNALNEFDQINDRLHPTGGFINSTANSVRKFFGNADLERIDQLSKGFARQQGAQEKGSVSNYEGKMFEGMVGGPNRPYSTNKSFSQAARHQSQEIINRHQFKDIFLQKNGTLVGSDAAYDSRPRKAPPSTRKGPSGWTVTETP